VATPISEVGDGQQESREILEGLFSDGKLRLSPWRNTTFAPRATSWKSRVERPFARRDAAGPGYPAR